MQTLLDGLNFWDTANKLFSLAVLICAAYLWIKGILPVLWRLGIGLSKREIAIFSDNEFDGLKSLLVDSKIFRHKNIVRIDKGSIRKAENLSLLLVDWKSFEGNIDEILQIKKDSAALIIYAPPQAVKPDDVTKINLHRNSIIVNMRGRLLNDILTSMMTTGFEEK